jgi:hypothetical protein
MIIVCAGDSFTYGAELWEEKNVPGYTDIKTNVAAFNLIDALERQRRESQNQYEAEYNELITKSYEKLIRNNSTDRKEILYEVKELKEKFMIDDINRIDAARAALAFSGILSKKLNNQVINLGRNGSAEIDTIQRAIKELIRLKNTTDEKIVCILQHTSNHRAWLKLGEYSIESVILTNIEKFIEDKLLAAEVGDVYMKYISDDLLQLEYLNCIFALNNFCVNLGIHFVHFSVSKYEIYENNSHLSDKFSQKKYYLGGMIDYLKGIFNNDNFFLPGHHINCESHELVADWLITEMKKRDIL